MISEFHHDGDTATLTLVYCDKNCRRQWKRTRAPEAALGVGCSGTKSRHNLKQSGLGRRLMVTNHLSLGPRQPPLKRKSNDRQLGPGNPIFNLRGSEMYLRGKIVRLLCDGSSDRSFMVNPLSYFSLQPVLHDLFNKGRGTCYPICGMMHIK